MNKETVLRIVDSCFHEFASSYINEGRDKASKLFDELNNEQYHECEKHRGK